MTGTIHLSSAELAEVRAILSRHLPPRVHVFVFGSRAGGRVKPWSDLDLLIEGPGPLPSGVLAELAEAFDESRLPWKVDLIERATTSDRFLRIIGTAKVPLDLTNG